MGWSSYLRTTTRRGNGKWSIKKSPLFWGDFRRRYLPYHTCIATLHPCIRCTWDIGTCELCVHIVDSPAILAKTDRNSIIFRRFLTLAWEYHSFSCDRHFMNESLFTKCIDDTVEGGEVHTTISFSYKSFLQIRKSHTSRFLELFHKTTTREGNTSFWHRDS